MTEIYKGVIVGGPGAGKWLQHNAPHWNAVASEGMPTSWAFEDKHPTAAFRHATYVYRNYNGTGLWVLETWGPEEVAAELAANYRPKAV